MEQIPKEIEHYFVIEEENFIVSTFEQHLLNDIYMHDENSKVKLNRDVTQDLFNEIEMYNREKRNLRFVVKGETRSGKSLIGLKIGDIIFDLRGIDFNKNITYYVCGNQTEYRKKLFSAKFGEFYLVDENLFMRGGLGANIEASQLVDYNNIIAKKNISVIFITPEKFLNVGATLGFSSYGRDSKNWLSKFLVYKFKDNFPYLIGYVKFDIGHLFRKHGCYVYKFVGGCNNVEEKTLNDIPKELIKHSSCIPITTESSNSNNCPFFDVCTHGLCSYEHKKDSWIEKEMTGGLDERSYERFKLALRLILDLEPYVDDESYVIKLKAKNGKDLKNKVKLKIHKFTNTKFGIAELDELIEIIKSCTDINFLKDTLKTLNDKETNDLFKESDLNEVII